MQNKEGVLIVLEGTDGAGKSTQFEILTHRLEDAGYDIATFKFPQYNEPSSYFIQEYLKGSYGTVDEVGPYTASLFYALDRFAAADRIRQELSQGKIVVVDRYTGSNMAHQGTKFHHADQRRGYFIWLDNLEFELLRIPRPNANFVLNVPAETAFSLLTDSEKTKDIHEVDIEHVRRSVDVFNDLSQLFPKDFIRVDCTRGGNLLSKEIISNLIWEKVFPLLPTEQRYKKNKNVQTYKEISAAVNNPYLEKTRTGVSISAAGREFLKEIITDSTGDTFAFKDKLNATTIAAALVSSSNSKQDLRTVLLDTFATDNTPEESKSRTFKQYGTTINNLIGIHVVVEHQSYLTSLLIDQCKQAAYITPLSQYERYDQKNSHGQYKYYTPERLSGRVAQAYRERMDKIFDNYSMITNHLTNYLRERVSMPKSEQTAAWRSDTRQEACRIALAVLPVASKSSTSIFATAKDVEYIIKSLAASELLEAQNISKSLLKQVHQILPGLHIDVDSSHINDEFEAVKRMSTEYLPETYAASLNDTVSLSEYWPRNELDLVPYMFYKFSNLPLSILNHTIDKWTYERKAEIMTTYLHDLISSTENSGSVLENVRYTWDTMSDFITFRHFLKYKYTDTFNYQHLTPRHGYEVPSIIEGAGIGDVFEACFDISVELHSLLIEAGLEEEAQYVTLLGHRLRWTTTFNARTAHILYRKYMSNKTNSDDARLVFTMHQKIAEIHPLIADSMIVET